ncbi:MAG TPA: hypothetical protein VNX86_11165 [Rhizomicrobium sp.]|jgi:hypothetical protein|nr:hypothetical protein [Rhizomicrobium sp.]
MSNFTRSIRSHAKPHTSYSVPSWKAATIMGVLVLAGFVARADAAPNDHDFPASDQLAQAQEICEIVVRVQPDDEHFEGCVSSLKGSLESVSREHAVVHARNKCFAQGLKPGSSDLAVCLLQAADATPSSDMMNAPIQVSQLIDTGEVPTSARSDFSASFDAVLQREQQACARLGLDPAFGAFANCVADLQDTLQRTDFPANQ